ncbi:MAG: hypothetical protein GY820_21290 [Gammaproteobacteria bacterium]|nr:hypothetical protein [Gammaproteobacteria bacterium]
MEEIAELNANPLSLIRGLPTKNIPIDQIQVRGVETDEIFLEKYTKFLTGKLKTYSTRIDIKNIIPGFYKPSSNGLIYICDEIPEKDVSYVEELVRLGDRPALHLYHNIKKDDSQYFVCPDDVAVFHAYSNLGINSVPSLILGSQKYTKESSIVIRSLKCTHNPYTPHIESITPRANKLVPSFLGVEKPAHEESFNTLIAAVEGVKSRLREFHTPGSIRLHYHHTLYSILLRAQETLEAMRLLFSKSLFINAASLVRNLYELALTFYIDWLAPTQMYKYLQLSSVSTTKQWEKLCQDEMKKQVRDGLSQSDAKKIFTAKMFGFRLTTVVSEKARIFPLGEEHHRDVYAFLSKIVHHDFSMVARYSYTLEHGDETIFNEDAMKTTIYCADVFTAAIVTRVIDDIGAAGEYHLESRNG